MNTAVHVEGVSVRFFLDRQQRVVTPALARLRRKGSMVRGLDRIDLSVAPGDGVALIGASGAGKTTLLRVLAGVLVPDAGRVRVSGRVGSLLAVGAGLTPVLTGRENAALLAVLAGLSRPEAKAALGRIGERSGLGTAFERPVSGYSSGMAARLGWAVIAETEPDVLLLDEVHEALDHDYRQVLDRAARALLERDGVVVATGHDLEILRQLCGRAVLLRHGRVTADGDFDAVATEYLAA